MNEQSNHAIAVCAVARPIGEVSAIFWPLMPGTRALPLVTFAFDRWPALPARATAS